MTDDSQYHADPPIFDHEETHRAMFATVMSDIVGLNNDRDYLRGLFYQEIERRKKRGGSKKKLRVGTVSRIKPTTWFEKKPYYRPLLIAEGTVLHDVVVKSPAGGYSFIAPHTETMGRFGGAKTLSTSGGIYTRESENGPFVRYEAVRTVFGRADTNAAGSTQKIIIETPHYRDIGRCSGIEVLQTSLGLDKVGSKRKNWGSFTVPDLKRRAKENGIKGGFRMRKSELISAFMKL